MLNRLLLVLDALLVITGGVLGVHLYRVWTAEPPGVSPPAGALTTLGPAAPGPAPSPAGSLSGFTMIAERNLFSPTRNETAPESAKPPTRTSATAPQVPKPRLYGVVLGRDGGPRAYLEDPRTRKVFGYAVGDTVAESRVERISADRVVLRRGEEVFEVLLRDPSKPKPAPASAPPTVPGVPGFPGQTPGSPQPGAPGQAVVPGASPFGQPGSTVPSVTPQAPAGTPFVPGRPPIRPQRIPLPPGAPTAPEPSGDEES